MSVQPGPLAGPPPNVTVRRRRRPYARPAAAALLALCLAPVLCAAQVPEPLTLAVAERLALADEPGEKSLEARAAALADRAVAAGRLPDLTLRVGLANFPIESGGFATEGMTQGQLGLRQAFPPGDTLEFARRGYDRRAAALTRSAVARRLDVQLALREAWLEARYWQQAEAIVSESRPLFADLVTATRSLYAVGRRDQQDVLRAELELSRLDDRLLGIAEREARARAALSEWIGAASDRPLAGTAATLSEPPGADELAARLDAHPAVSAADARIEAVEADAELARQAFRPGWALDLGYGYRDGLLPDGSPRSDFVTLAVTVDLPFLGRERRSRELAAALAERRAAGADREALLRSLASRLAVARARYDTLERRVALYESSIVAQAGERAAAALAAYQSEAGDFADVMRGRIDELNAELELLRLYTERAQSVATLRYLGGLDR